MSQEEMFIIEIMSTFLGLTSIYFTLKKNAVCILLLFSLVSLTYLPVICGQYMTS